MRGVDLDTVWTDFEADQTTHKKEAISARSSFTESEQTISSTTTPVTPYEDLLLEIASLRRDLAQRTSMIFVTVMLFLAMTIMNVDRIRTQVRRLEVARLP
jgi:hypothetical protein